MAQHFSLGVHVGDDRGAALVKNGELIAQIAEARLDRRKHPRDERLLVTADCPDRPNQIWNDAGLGQSRPADDRGRVGVKD